MKKKNFAKRESVCVFVREGICLVCLRGCLWICVCDRMNVNEGKSEECVCAWERESEREWARKWGWVWVRAREMRWCDEGKDRSHAMRYECAWVGAWSVCVCEREREKEMEKERDREVESLFFLSFKSICHQSLKPVQSNFQFTEIKQSQFQVSKSQLSFFPFFFFFLSESFDVFRRLFNFWLKNWKFGIWSPRRNLMRKSAGFKLGPFLTYSYDVQASKLSGRVISHSMLATMPTWVRIFHPSNQKKIVLKHIWLWKPTESFP